MEEFQEADVIWSDNFSGDVERPIGGGGGGGGGGISESPLRDSRRGRQRGESDPVKIPNGRRFKAAAEEVVVYGDYDEEEEEEKWEASESEEMVPPHLVIARRVARKTTFSVCTGTGRTLKGRDLSRLRNSVLRMTGFLEA
ncbi:hypothetical protein H6P81_014261 [Aristolochia fimbriata]|uniref:Senescence regulator n=1 Tax=Aristolochia fimbriata TaxID=158543 RepID=A0AAV7EH14_ARIFI|nr:hypothetical protein H6P81_014261 [Aristolochia fimbriata]